MIKQKLIDYLTTYQHVILYIMTLIGCSFLFSLFFSSRISLFKEGLSFISMNYQNGFTQSLDSIKTYFFISIMIYLVFFFFSIHPFGSLTLSFILFFKFFCIFSSILYQEKTLFYIIYLLFEIIIEVGIYLIISSTCLEISLNVYQSAFLGGTSLNILKVMNYFLDRFLMVLILHCIHCLILIYL